MLGESALIYRQPGAGELLMPVFQLGSKDSMRFQGMIN
jgi:hypothetical protein